MATITRTNLATNPSFEYPDFTTTSRINLCPNPNFETGIGLWAKGSNCTNAASTVQKFAGTQSLATTRSNTTAGSCYARFSFTSVVGSTYTASIYVYGGAGPANSYQLKMTGAATSTILNFTPPGAVWTRYSVTATASSSGTVNVYVTDDDNLAPVAGTIFYVDNCLVEVSDTMDGYFDGDTTNTSNTVYLWTGTAGASTSQTWPIPAVGGIDTSTKMSTGGGALVYMDPSWTSPDSAGYCSVRVDSSVATGNSTSCYPFQLNVGMLRMGVQAGHTYTASATIRMTAAQTGTLDVSARCITFGTTVNGVDNYVAAVSPAAPNAAGVTRLTVTFTVPPTATRCWLRLMNGEGPIGGSGGSVWWDDLLLEEVAYARPYFDGNTTGYTNTTYSPPAQSSFSWVGTANRSLSLQTDIVPLQNYQVQAPDGTLLGAGTTVGLLEVVGLRGSASTRSADTDRAGVDGMSPGMSLLTGRTVGVKWLITDPHGVEPALQLLSKNWQNTVDPSAIVMTARDYLLQYAGGGSRLVSALQFQVPGRDVPFMAFGKPGKLDPPVNSSYQFGWLEVNSDWFVPDGKIYDAGVNTATTGLPTSLGGAKFKWTFPVNFGPSTSSSFQIANDGKYPAKPVFRIDGPVTNPQILNLTTGQIIRVNVSVPAGNVLLIDSDSRVVRLNGANRNNALDVSSSFFTVPPGGASLSFASTDAGTVSGTLTAYTLNTYSAA